MLILSHRDLKLKKINIILPKKKIKEIVMSRDTYYDFNSSKIYESVMGVLSKNYILTING